MNLFQITLREDTAGLDLCIRVASLLILQAQRPRAKEYEQNENDLKRMAMIVEGLKRYIRECGLRKEGNLECVENGKCLARIHEIGKIDFLYELNRVRDFAVTGEWRPRQFIPGPEPYEPVTLEEIDATIEKIENQLTAKGMA